ncbi:CCA tRNA nucleotidyltransferase [Clostridium sp. Marseille-Q2269]|uniref:CCA tRNA nucleotidyltransferase n=1 Tax=Clostridium sp. Marseille-Q2269 TaxID=2942205 RepID=UPI0020744B7E|nr:CCA tRNA nucleotidyltransferase [Clostridium sp. Marseille-Q2269]
MISEHIKILIPKWVKYIIDTLENQGYEGYIVGGCVRDSLLSKNPNDWDITTNAKPQQIMGIFKNLQCKIIPTGLKHGTVTIIFNNENFEITTYRIDGEYEDNRHPKEVKFTSSLKEDLRRRDFTINAMAYSEKNGLVDYFNGVEDLKNKIIRCVGDPLHRYNEDALRMLRCIRFASQLNFHIEKSTKFSIRELSVNISNVSIERIRVELCKILISSKPAYGIRNMVKLNLIDYIIPELKDCIGFEQHNKHHDKDAYDHILCVLENIPNKLELRLSALLHDIGKPKCFSIGDDGQGHFYGHEKISSDITKKILTRLKFDNKTIDKVHKLVYNHMTIDDKLKDSSIKKFINRVGIHNLDDLFQLQMADIKGCAKEYHNFHNVLNLKIKCEKILSEKQPLKVKDLDITGYDLMKLGIRQGKEIGTVLNKLLDIVLEKPNLNNKKDLIELVKSL